MNCPNCGEASPEGATWCEACGQELAAPLKPICVACGEQEVAEDGYCQSCGHRQPLERDHQVFVAGAVVAVTDKGRRHRHNEDAVAIGAAADGTAVLVVCDGVSSTPGSAEASLQGAAAARDLLVEGLGSNAAGAGETVVPVSALLERAVEVAQAAASAVPDLEPIEPAHDGGPPSSTLVAVVVRPTDDGTELTTAWVGDSRAYWVGPGGARRLSTEDHELAGSLVRWLGADSIDPRADTTVTTVTGPGLVVVCSDGLWRYASEPEELEELLRRLSEEGNIGLDLASGLVAHANEQGGHDNITVALWSNQPGWPAEPATPGDESNEESNR